MLDWKFLMSEVFDSGKNRAELLLWIPASKPYYHTNNIFSRNEGYTKTLIFSSWEMVPRMIAGLVSYESERLVVERLGESYTKGYYADENKKRQTSIRLNNITEEVILYPSHFLATIYNPIEFIDNDLSMVKRDIKTKINQKLEMLREKYTISDGSGGAKRIIDLLKVFDGHEPEDSEMLISNDTLDLLVNMAIGSPGVCTYRIFKNDDFAKYVSQGFVKLFNKK